jgi:hypothetical protein
MTDAAAPKHSLVAIVQEQTVTSKSLAGSFGASFEQLASVHAKAC